MCNPNANVIVEYGPGTGNISRHILRNLRPHGTLILIEKNPELAEMLGDSIHDPRARIYCDSARNVTGILQRSGVKHVDHVISGIPGKEVTNELLTSTKHILSHNGSFIVYQFLPFLERRLKRTFERVERCLLPWNVPPLFLLEARGKNARAS